MSLDILSGSTSQEKADGSSRCQGLMKRRLKMFKTSKDVVGMGKIVKNSVAEGNNWSSAHCRRRFDLADSGLLRPVSTQINGI